MSANPGRHASRIDLGERNVIDTSSSNNNAGDFFDVKRPKIKYPEVLEKHPQQQEYKWSDPYQHMGPIGYTKNRYQFRGQNKDDNNIYGGQHMKKTAWLEEMRRRIIAEKEGISADIDDSSIAGTASAFHVSTREKRNKYINKPSIVPSSWAIPNQTSSKTSTSVPPSR